MLIESWVLWTLLAATMQAIRTAGQKNLTGEMSALSATLVRYLFGLPFALLWLGFVSRQQDFSLPGLNTVFILSGFAAGILQITATFLLIRLFTLRNFAVGSTYVKSEILLTAVIGYFFFTETVTLVGWLAIIVCVIGLVTITVSKTGGIKSLWNQSAGYGLSSGLCFALTSLYLRQASLSLGTDDSMLAAGMTLAYMVSLQTVTMLAWVRIQQPGQISVILRNWRPSLFVGITSVVGSVGWFTAMTLELASYVKTLGQLEFLFTVLIAVFYFKEKPTRLEVAGMLLIVSGGVALLLN